MSTSLYDLMPGTRVVVCNAGHLTGKRGEVLSLPAVGYDVAILLDEDIEYGDNSAMGFDADELAVEK